MLLGEFQQFLRDNVIIHTGSIKITRKARQNVTSVGRR